MSWITKAGAFVKIANTKEFSVNAFGAKNSNTTSSTKGIQDAIDACAKNGGGIVTFQTGSYVMGSIYSKSNVHLRIDAKVTLLGSQHFNEYPDIHTRVEGMEMEWSSALINVINATNVVISGKGLVDAMGTFCSDHYKKTKEEFAKTGKNFDYFKDGKRIRALLIQNSSDVELKDITIKNSCFWTVHVLYSTRITVDGITISNNEKGFQPNTDGIDVDSSTWVLVQNCDIDTNDDNYCLKSGKDLDGLRVNRSAEYIVVKDSISRRGGGLLVWGSETSGGIKHVYATNLTAIGTYHGVYIKSNKNTGGTVEDVHLKKIHMENVGFAWIFDMNDSYGSQNKFINASVGTPHFRDVFVDEVSIKDCNHAFTASGLPESPLTNFQFHNVNITASNAGEVNHYKDWVWNTVNIISKDKSTLHWKNKI